MTHTGGSSLLHRLILGKKMRCETREQDVTVHIFSR